MFGTVAQSMLQPLASVPFAPLPAAAHVPCYDSLASNYSPPPVPAPPKVVAISETSVRATWVQLKAVPPITHYAVVYSLAGGPERYIEEGTLTGRGIGEGVVPGWQSSVVIRSLELGGDIIVRVAARNGAGWSQYSMASQPVKLEAPSTPDIVKVEVLDGQSVRVTWRPLAGESVTTCYALIFVAEDESQLYVDARTCALQQERANAESFPAEQTSVVVQGAAQEARYQAKVAAKNMHGWSDYSALSEAFAIETPPAPEAPLLEVVGERAVRVSWEAVSCIPRVTHYGLVVFEAGVEKYVDLRSGTLKAEPIGLDSFPAHVLSCLLLELLPDTHYQARLAARNEVGWGLHSRRSPSCLVQWKQQAPDTPEPPRIEVLDINCLRISWLPVESTPAVSHYAVVVSEGGEDRYVNKVTRTIQPSRAGAEVLQSFQTELAVHGLCADVAYRAKVAAKNDKGWSNYSMLSAAVFVVAAPQPQPPTLERLTNTSMRVSWTLINATPPVTRYGLVVNEAGQNRYIDGRTGTLQRDREGSESFLATQSSVVVSGLSATTAYRAKIAARNEVGWGMYSEYSGELSLAPERPHTG